MPPIATVPSTMRPPSGAAGPYRSAPPRDSYSELATEPGWKLRAKARRCRRAAAPQLSPARRTCRMPPRGGGVGVSTSSLGLLTPPSVGDTLAHSERLRDSPPPGGQVFVHPRRFWRRLRVTWRRRRQPTRAIHTEPSNPPRPPPRPRNCGGGQLPPGEVRSTTACSRLRRAVRGAVIRIIRNGPNPPRFGARGVGSAGDWAAGDGGDCGG